MKNTKITPLKKFGQNFLNDPNIIRKIVSSFRPCAGEQIVEIGPGMGALTRELAASGAKLKAVELDPRCIEHLANEFPALHIIKKDFLKLDLATLLEENGEKLRVIGNIPYYITTPILFKLLESKHMVSDVMMMVQLEIANRLSAQPRTKEYGILAVVFQTFCNVEILFKVSPNVFIPVPKVWSAVIRVTYKDQVEGMRDEKVFIQTVRAAFGNRRKVLRNSFKNSIFSDLNFDNCPIDLQKRAEELTIADFVALSRYIGEEKQKRN